MKPRISSRIALLICGFTIFGGGVRAENISLGKTYRYDVNVPGQDPIQGDGFDHYQDDPHDVYSNATAFDSGDLTDGIEGIGTTDANVPSPIIAIWKGAAANPPLPLDITFDLEGAFAITQITIGTSLRGDNGANGNYAPDDVSISFSADNITYSTPVNYALWATTETLGIGHHEKTLSATNDSVQFVKLSFDGQDTEKYVLDEITIEGEEGGLPPLQITDVQLLPGDEVQLTWNSQPGKVYTVYYTTDLLDFGANAGDDYHSDGDTTTVVIDTSLAPIDTAPTLLFRVSENS